MQTLFGDKIHAFVLLCEKAREEAFEELVKIWRRCRSAIIAMRYDANEVMPGVTEVLAYGTAVYVEKS